MPYASSELRRLRLRTGIKVTQWAERVQYTRNAYTNVETGRRPASPEMFGRCAVLLAVLLGVDVEVDDLIARGDDDENEDEHEHTDAGTGPPNRGDSTGPGRFQPESAQARGAA